MLLLLLSLIFTPAWSAYDLPCDADACVIPYDSEGTQNGVEICYNDETKSEKVIERNWKDGRREGPVRCWEKGKPAFEANYKNDVLQGVYVDYDYDSTGARVTYLENNEEAGLTFSVKDGKVTRLHYCMIGGTQSHEDVLSCETGDLGKFAKPVAEFRAEELKKNKLAAAAEAKRRNGPQESKYRDGKIKAKWTNVDGRIHGKFESFFENGKIQSDCSYKNGKEDGLCLTYDSEGRLDKKETWMNGKVAVTEIFFDNGKTESVTDTKSGRACVISYYDTGVKNSEYCSSSDRWWMIYEGPYKYWSQDGELIVDGTYEKEQRTGKWNYYSDKQIERELIYEKDSLVKSTDYFYNVPQHRIVREYFPDGSVKTESRLEGLEGDGKKMI